MHFRGKIKSRFCFHHHYFHPKREWNFMIHFTHRGCLHLSFFSQY
uniref:Uncharacterized protein n=1 Tax=Anguilla anguilla TaxID=7936 RepID=A0A0E9X6E8_ANGAN